MKHSDNDSACFACGQSFQHAMCRHTCGSCLIPISQKLVQAHLRTQCPTTLHIALLSDLAPPWKPQTGRWTIQTKRPNRCSKPSRILAPLLDQELEAASPIQARPNASRRTINQKGSHQRDQDARQPQSNLHAALMTMAKLMSCEWTGILQLLSQRTHVSVFLQLQRTHGRACLCSSPEGRGMASADETGTHHNRR